MTDEVRQARSFTADPKETLSRISCTRFRSSRASSTITSNPSLLRPTERYAAPRQFRASVGGEGLMSEGRSRNFEDMQGERLECYECALPVI